MPLSLYRGQLLPLDVQPGKVYIAASLHNREAAMVLQRELFCEGFQVTSRWINADFSKKPTDVDSQEYAQFEKEWGMKDFEDVSEADTLVVLADVPSSTGGFHVELGMFLGAGKKNIVAVGGRPNVFFYHDSVKWRPTTEGLAAWLVEETRRERRKSAADVDYDAFVEEMWYYNPDEHGGMPELGYTALKMGGECGETQEKIGKAYRDNRGVVPDELGLMKELGDQMFYITKIAHKFGRTLRDVLNINVDKLRDRAARGKMRGSGDDR